MQADIARLRQRHPGWNFTAAWTFANSSAQGRKLVGWRGDIVVSAPSAAELSQKIAREDERARGSAG